MNYTYPLIEKNDLNTGLEKPKSGKKLPDQLGNGQQNKKPAN